MVDRCPALVVMIALTACNRVGESDDTDTIGGNTGVLLGIGLTPNDPIIGVGDSVQFKAEAFFDDTTHADVTASVQWEQSDERIATVDGGEASGVEAGQCEIIAIHPDGPSAQVTLTVRSSDSSLESAFAQPDVLQLQVGETAQVVVQANWSDGTSGNIASSCAWSSDSVGVASVDASGAVTGVAEGSAVVEAECEGITLEVDVTVSEQGGTGSVDLRISAFTAVVAGDDVTYTATVVNDGDSNAGPFTLGVYLDRSSAPTVGAVSSGSAWVSGLAADASIPVAITLTDLPSGSYDSWALADAGGTVEEGSESNNASGPLDVSLGSGSADLEITTFEGISDGGYTLYEITIENTGSVATTGFWIDLFYDVYSEPQNGDLGDDFIYVAGLAPGASTTWEPDVEDGPWGYYDYWESALLVDGEEYVSESDESDNVAWTTVWGEY